MRVFEEDCSQNCGLVLSRTPASRWGQPEEIAGTAVYLASRVSDFVTGETICVDGGYAIR
ncbi:MAG TPA: SDR family oxidoreductase [Acidobacteriaceae bacterium]|nr:SDR family oxidoreductase [Acidobacteriaceae bacterium]